MKKLKSVKIDEETYKILKKFCDDNGYKIYKFISLIIQKEIENRDKKSGIN